MPIIVAHRAIKSAAVYPNKAAAVARLTYGLDADDVRSYCALAEDEWYAVDDANNDMTDELVDALHAEADDIDGDAAEWRDHYRAEARALRAL